MMTSRPPFMHDLKSDANLHFMFLGISDVHHAPLWKAFFDTAPEGSYSLWLHCKDRDACLVGQFMQLLPETHLVPTVETTYCTDLVTAHVQLLRHALLEIIAPKARNEKFVLMSDSTLPVKPFSIIHGSLTEHPESNLCIYPTSDWRLTAELPENKTVYLVEHSQFTELSRKDAKSFIEAWDLQTGGHPWLGVQEEGWINATSWGWKSHVRPVWDVRILEPGTSVDHAEHTSLTRFRGLLTCADEEAVFSLLHGAPVFNESHGMEVPGFGNLAFNRNSCQGRCSTYFSSYNWSMDNRTLERELATDISSQVRLPHVDKLSHPVRFGTLSERAIHKLRASPWLFVRKFEPDAELSGYKEHIVWS